MSAIVLYLEWWSATQETCLLSILFLSQFAELWYYFYYITAFGIIVYITEIWKHLVLDIFFFLYFFLESVYDLLPKELQLPPSRELSVASMSQTSGGEAGSPPPGVVAAGKYFHWARLST